jgi:hypothetical protein
VGVGSSSGRKHDEVGLQKGAVVERRADPVRELFDPLDLAVEAKLDSPLADLYRQRAAHVVVEAAQEQVAPMHYRELRTQTVENSREFETDITTADNDRAGRKLWKKEGLVRGDRQFAAGN